jgi:hypothetical protein
MVMSGKRGKDTLRIAQFACVATLVSVVGGLTLAYRLETKPVLEVLNRPMGFSMRCSDAADVFQRRSVDDPAGCSALLSQACAD